MRIGELIARLFVMDAASKEQRQGPPYQNPMASPPVNILPPYEPSVWRRMVRAGKPLVRDEEKIKKAEAKRERKQKRGW